MPARPVSAAMEEMLITAACAACRRKGRHWLKTSHLAWSVVFHFPLPLVFVHRQGIGAVQDGHAAPLDVVDEDFQRSTCIRNGLAHLFHIFFLSQISLQTDMVCSGAGKFFFHALHILGPVMPGQNKTHAPGSEFSCHGPADSPGRSQHQGCCAANIHALSPCLWYF